MKVPLLDLKKQNSELKNAALQKFSEIFDSGSFILGKEVEEFEKNTANYLGAKHVIGVSSGTDAILVALMAIGIKENDEVICPSFTFFATAGCIARLGAKPVFADIDLDNFNISIDDIRRKTTKCTKAILPVHLFGQAANMTQILQIGQELGVHVIEDCAQSLGAKHNNKQTGTFGLAGCFSFFPSKNLGGFGDSGLVCTDDDDFAEQIKVLRMHGMKPQYFHKYIGGNFRIDAVQAALLNIKLPHVDSYIANRRKNAEIYIQELGNLDGIILPKEENENFHTWNQFTIRVLNGRRDAVLNMLKSNEIGCNIYYPVPLHKQECFAKFVDKRNILPNSETAAQEVLSLPIYPELSSSEILHVAKTLKNILKS